MLFKIIGDATLFVAVGWVGQSLTKVLCYKVESKTRKDTHLYREQKERGTGIYVPLNISAHRALKCYHRIL